MSEVYRAVLDGELVGSAWDALKSHCPRPSCRRGLPIDLDLGSVTFKRPAFRLPLPLLPLPPLPCPIP